MAQPAIAPDILVKLVADAQALGQSFKAHNERFDERTKQLKADSKDAEESGRGFTSPQFQGYRALAQFVQDKLIGNGKPYDKKHAEAVSAVVAAYERAYTGRTDKSAKGGNSNNVAKIVAGGNIGVRMLDMMHQQREYWRAERDNAPSDESGAARRETAERYLSPAGLCPIEEGGPVQWVDDKGQPAKAKHFGRPSKTITIHGKVIDIPFGRATNTLSQAAFLAGLVRQYGERVINPAVVDAVLDNGGKVGKLEQSANDIAASAKALIEKLVTMDPTSIHAPALQMLSETLGGIASHGLVQHANAAEQGSAWDDAAEDATTGTETPSDNDPDQGEVTEDSNEEGESVPETAEIPISSSDVDAALAGLLGPVESEAPKPPKRPRRGGSLG